MRRADTPHDFKRAFHILIDFVTPATVFPRLMIAYTGRLQFWRARELIRARAASATTASPPRATRDEPPFTTAPQWLRYRY